MAKYSKKAQKYISEKISKLHREGYRGSQLKAIALSYARKRGHKIPKAEKKSGDNKMADGGIMKSIKEKYYKSRKWNKDKKKKSLAERINFGGKYPNPDKVKNPQKKQKYANGGIAKSARYKALEKLSKKY